MRINNKHVTNVQALMYNDCVYRARQTQKYLMFNDRDEFLHIKGRHPNIKHFLNHQFDSPALGSIIFWGSVYFVHCTLTQVPDQSFLIFAQ